VALTPTQEDGASSLHIQQREPCGLDIDDTTLLYVQSALADNDARQSSLDDFLLCNHPFEGRASHDAGSAKSHDAKLLSAPG